jgi:hypothetical protein
VDNVAFVTSRYACAPATEDLGREQTDDCEPWLFCARQPEGDSFCGELVPYTGAASDYEDKACLVDEQCHTDEICFNPRFRTRNPEVVWYGPDNTCVPYQIDHHRVEVALAIAFEQLPFISKDSRASVASKGVLGDQQINIDVGKGPPVEPGGRLQAEPTLLEELNRFRERVAAVTERFSGNLTGLRELRGSVRTTPGRPPDMRSSLARLDEVTSDIVAKRGQLGELFAPDARVEFIDSLHELRASTDKTGRELANWRNETASGLRKVAKETRALGDGAHQATDPKSESAGAKWLMDERFGLDTAERVSEAGDSIAQTREAIAKVQESVDELERELDAGEGPLGELVRDPSLYYRFVKAIAMFDLFDRNDAFKGLVRDVLEAGDGSARPGTTRR